MTAEDERRLREVDAATMRLGQRWFDVFAGEFSIPAHFLETIPKLWQQQRAKHPGLTPAAFAHKSARRIFTDLVPLD